MARCIGKIGAILDQTSLEKAIKWSSDVYTYNKKNVVSYGAFKQYVAIWFYNGVFMPDPANKLISAQEGKTKSLRQWRITDVQDLDESLLLAYVDHAIEVEKKGLKLAPTPNPMPEIPAILSEAFAQEPELETAFFALRAGCQKEYLFYLNEAKQEVTKRNRLEKIRPMIHQQKGLNDKYKK